MLKKRLIFTLLYENGHFMLSRNFRLQRVGDFEWLRAVYDFSRISYSIDELIVLDVSRGDRRLDDFCHALSKLSERCFVPIAAGGGVRSVDAARQLLRSGADKVVVNTALYLGCKFLDHLASEFGQQCVVASMDLKHGPDGEFHAWSDCGRVCQPGSAANWVGLVSNAPIGDLYINSVDRDGTGTGYDLRLLDLLPNDMPRPVILAGGVGNSIHLAEGLADHRVDAVATAHLFNFVGDGLKRARDKLIAEGFDLPVWDAEWVG